MASDERIIQRIETKKRDYQAYDFTQQEDSAFKAFFDLAQELDGAQEFYGLCVQIPRIYFNLDCRLFLVSPSANRFALAASSDNSDPRTAAPELPGNSISYSPSGSLVISIRGKRFLMDQLPFHCDEDVLGMMEIYPADSIDEHQKFFFEKFANRIGFNLHNRFIVEKNIEHLNFIRTLAADIEHNIIAPNIIYNLFIRKIRGALQRSIALEQKLAADGSMDAAVVAELKDINVALSGELEDMTKHHKNMSLFLETLLRRSHFDQGRLTLRTKSCNMYKDVLLQQIERYSDRFKNLEIEIDNASSGIPKTDIINVVDVGLMAQVYANLFSNALKYTEEVETKFGRKKYISYGYEYVRDIFGPGKHGHKYNVFSTGPHIAPGERESIFEDNYRGSNVGQRPGTGHGLSFIKKVVEIHGGIAGYEPTEFGNNFYFVLPE